MYAVQYELLLIMYIRELSEHPLTESLTLLWEKSLNNDGKIFR